MREIVFQGVRYMLDTNAVYDTGAMIQLPDGRVLKVAGCWLEVCPPIPEGLEEVTTVKAMRVDAKPKDKPVPEPTGKIQRVTFFNAPDQLNAYHCSEGDGQSGAYVYKELADDLLAACEGAAERLLQMERLEIEGDTPQGRDCGEVGRRLEKAIAKAVKPWADE